MDILGADYEIELAVLFQDIAFAHRAGDNRNHGKPLEIQLFRAGFAGGYSREA
jgi:hypothetical protein